MSDIINATSAACYHCADVHTRLNSLDGKLSAFCSDECYNLSGYVNVPEHTDVLHDIGFEFDCSCEILPSGEIQCCDVCDTTLDPSGELETFEMDRVYRQLSRVLDEWTPPSEIARELELTDEIVF